jgi:UDP-N-acetylmuramoylalanine--D-glutamate ligase
MAGMPAFVEGFSPDAVAVAALLAAEGVTVRLVGPGPAPTAALALREVGVVVEDGIDLDTAPVVCEVAYLDVWTPEIAPRVGRLRAAGVRISSIGDLVLERAAGPVVGITGTAGKTTAAGLLVHLLRAAGVPVLASDASASANRWPDGALLSGAPRMAPGAVLVVELTSSHLAFMSRSPAVALVTTFWPDHVELHGSVEAYRAAKERIVRHQRPGDCVLVDRSRPEVARFAELSPARRVAFSSEGGEPGDGALAWIAGEEVVLAGGARAPLPAGAAFRGARAVNVAAACAAALAAGAAAESVAAARASAPLPPHRARELRAAGGTRVLDDGMAATPAKASATLARLPDGAAVVVCGGDDHPAWGAVHASPEERAALERACDELARAAAAVVVFGPAAPRLRALLRERGRDALVAEGLDDAVPLALEQAGRGGLVAFAPMFPVPAAERLRLAELVAAHVS